MGRRGGWLTGHPDCIDVHVGQRGQLPHGNGRRVTGNCGAAIVSAVGRPGQCARCAGPSRPPGFFQAAVEQGQATGTLRLVSLRSVAPMRLDVHQVAVSLVVAASVVTTDMAGFTGHMDGFRTFFFGSAGLLAGLSALLSSGLLKNCKLQCIIRSESFSPWVATVVSLWAGFGRGRSRSRTSALSRLISTDGCETRQADGDAACAGHPGKQVIRFRATTMVTAPALTIAK
jgi:hypothetical protein